MISRQGVGHIHIRFILLSASFVRSLNCPYSWLLCLPLGVSCEQEGETALSIAVRKGHRDVALRVLDLGADPTVQDNDVIPPLGLVALACIIFFSSRVVMPQGNTPLHVAVKTKSVKTKSLDLVDPLVEKGAVIDAKNDVSMGPAGSPVWRSLSTPLFVPASLIFPRSTCINSFPLESSGPRL